MRRVSWHRWVVDDASVHRADLSSPSPSLPCPLPERLTGRCFGNVAAWILSGLANCWPENACGSSGRSRDSGTRTRARRRKRKGGERPVVWSSRKCFFSLDLISVHDQNRRRALVEHRMADAAEQK